MASSDNLLKSIAAICPHPSLFLSSIIREKSPESQHFRCFSRLCVCRKILLKSAVVQSNLHAFFEHFWAHLWKSQMTLRGFPGRIAFGWSMLNPCMSQVNSS